MIPLAEGLTGETVEPVFEPTLSATDWGTGQLSIQYKDGISNEDT